MGYRPLRYCRVTQLFGTPGSYASLTDAHGPAGHHTGLDFGRNLLFPTLRGSKVRSSTPGVVIHTEGKAVGTAEGPYGNRVDVYFAEDNVTLTYWHMMSIYVRVGQVLERGHIIGRVGSTGNSSAPHLHVQANYGRGFNYHGHIAPAHWVRGEEYAGQPAPKRKKKEA